MAPNDPASGVPIREREQPDQHEAGDETAEQGDAFDSPAPLARTPRFSFASSRVGDRAGRVRDPLGKPLWVMARMQEVDEDELERRWGERRYPMP